MKLVGFKYLDEMSPPSDVDHKLDDYFKFLVVRDPWTRLLSAFRDNFEKYDSALQDLFHQSYGRIIVERYRKNGSKLKFVTFLVFQQFKPVIILHFHGPIKSFHGNKSINKTRMHSSRMCTAHLLTVSSGARGGGCLPGRGRLPGVSSRGCA